MIELCSIASGSNGNCYYIGNQHEAILIDAGISAKQIILRMRSKNLNPEKIRAVFISHEHSDHTVGARVLAKRLHVPVYLTSRTYLAMYRNLQPFSPRFFEPGKVIHSGSFAVHPFLKNHDASEPCSFRVEYEDRHVGVFTDIGSPCDNVTSHLNQCHALFLETNYDEKMLWNGPYPWPLKKRIASDHGHLSNDQAFNLLNDHAGNHLRLVFLSHLSAENNKPEIARERFREMDGKIQIELTSRYSPGDVFHLK